MSSALSKEACKSCPFHGHGEFPGPLKGSLVTHVQISSAKDFSNGTMRSWVFKFTAGMLQVGLPVDVGFKLLNHLEDAWRVQSARSPNKVEEATSPPPKVICCHGPAPKIHRPLAVLSTVPALLSSWLVSRPDFWIDDLDSRISPVCNVISVAGKGSGPHLSMAIGMVGFSHLHHFCILSSNT